MKLQKLCPIAMALIFFTLLLLVHAGSTQPPFACDSSNSVTNSYPFCKTSLPISERAEDLVSRLTLDEKIHQLVNTVPAIPRLGIPAYEWWSEALHGIANGIKPNATIESATSFPQVILTAASFDVNLWYRIGQVIGTEARGVYNAGQATGMTFWAPNINIFRDPRWGRGQETPGEDPLVTSKYSVAFVRGIQGDSFDGEKLHPYLQASACCKHFTAYDLENWNNNSRFVFDAKVTSQDMADTYQPPFKSCVEKGRASGIMCGYNRVNGVPTCADYDLLTKTARGQWGFDGYIVSDCDSVFLIHDVIGYAKTREEAVNDVLTAGLDVNCGGYLRNYTKLAVDNKRVEISQIDRALRNLFAVRMRLGLFDGNPSRLPFGNIGPNQVCSQEHQALALEAAKDGIVLLKNNAENLPLPKSQPISLAVIGPNANASQTLLGNYFGIPCKLITPLEGLQNFVQNVIYHSGCNAINCTSCEIEKAVEIAKEVDYVVMVMGLDQGEEKEGLDRVHLELPGKQYELIDEVAKVAKKPVVLVIYGGGPVDVSRAKFDNKIGSMLWAGYPGEAGGQALAEIIFGDHNPGGRLPMTWYPNDFIKVPMTDMRMRSQPSSGYPGRTYRFYTGPKVFEFGYGLSYTNYTYYFLSTTETTLYLNYSSAARVVGNSKSRLVSDLNENFCNNKAFKVKVGVHNEGKIAGKHSVLLFKRQEKGINGSPIKQLVEFQSVSLNGGEEKEVEFWVNPCEHFSSANEDGVMVLEEGSHYLIVGDLEQPINIFV